MFCRKIRLTQLNSDRDTAKTHREDTQGISQRHKMATSLDVPVAEPYHHIVGVSAQLGARMQSAEVAV